MEKQRKDASNKDKKHKDKKKKKKKKEEKKKKKSGKDKKHKKEKKSKAKRKAKKEKSQKMAITSSPTERRIPAANARLVLFRSRRTTRLANCVRKDFSNRSVRAIGARRVRKACTKTKKVRGFANRATDRRYRRTI